MNDALVLLHRAIGQEISDCCVPVNYTFLHGEFSSFAALIPGNDEIVKSFETCASLSKERTTRRRPAVWIRGRLSATILV
mgnify:CR=1 FL=1